MSEHRVEAVERALSILDSFESGEEQMPLARLAAKTGMHKSTILRLAGSLERFGYLRRGGDGRFRLGPSLWRLGSLYRRGFDLGDHVQPALRRLVETTQETAAFYVREGGERVCLYRRNSPRAARHHIDEGGRLPLLHGAAGRVLIAFEGGHDPTSMRVRGDGFYVSLGERDAEVGAAAVPVFDAAGAMRGALSVSGLISRFDPAAQRHAVEMLKQEAARLRADLPGGMGQTEMGR